MHRPWEGLSPQRMSEGQALSFQPLHRRIPRSRTGLPTQRTAVSGTRPPCVPRVQTRSGCGLLPDDASGGFNPRCRRAVPTAGPRPPSPGRLSGAKSQQEAVFRHPTLCRTRTRGADTAGTVRHRPARSARTSPRDPKSRAKRRATTWQGPGPVAAGHCPPARHSPHQGFLSPEMRGRGPPGGVPASNRPWE